MGMSQSSPIPPLVPLAKPAPVASRAAISLGGEVGAGLEFVGHSEHWIGAGSIGFDRGEDAILRAAYLLRLESSRD